MSVSDRTSNAKACSSIVCICRVTVIPTKATLAPGRALFVQNWTAFRFLSNKYSFTARASTMRVFFLHWCFSIQGWSKGQNYSCATICMIHSVYDAAFPICPLHVWFQVVKGDYLCKAFNFIYIPWVRPQCKASGWKMSLNHFPRNCKCSAALQIIPAEIHCRGGGEGGETLVGDCRERQ